MVLDAARLLYLKGNTTCTLVSVQMVSATLLEKSEVNLEE